MVTGRTNDNQIINYLVPKYDKFLEKICNYKISKK